MKRLIAIIFLGVSMLISSVYAYDWSVVDPYTIRSDYGMGEVVQYDGNLYQCIVGSQCSQGGAYTPGIGKSWKVAWSDLGSCTGASGSGGGSSTGGANGLGSRSCDGLPIWNASSVYVGGNQVQHNTVKYEAKWWTKNDNPEQSGEWDVWKNLGPCGGSSSGSSSGGGGTRVIGYSTEWSGSASTIDYGKLTHINYAFVLPNADGTIGAVPNPTKLKALVSNGHANKVKVLISIGGWNNGNDSAFVSFAASATGRTNFTNAMINLVEQYNLDGVDIDWEYPDPGAESATYSLLMRQLADAMHSRNKLLTAAVVALGNTGGGVKSDVFNMVDFLNLMAYDGGNGANHSPYSYAVDSLNYWTGRGLPAEKAVLGVPYYTRPGWSDYSSMVSKNAANRCRDTDGKEHWNGILTMRRKGLLASKYGGIMTWEMAQDTTGPDSLLTAMWEAVNGKPGSFICK